MGFRGHSKNMGFCIMSYKLTFEFLRAVKTCDEGIKCAEDNHYCDGTMTYMDVVKDLIRQGYSRKPDGDWAEWLVKYKDSEEYILYCGGKTTVTAYVVYNPLTGQNETCETKEEMDDKLLDIANEVLKKHCPIVNEVHTNEEGDSTWIPIKEHNNLTVVKKILTETNETLVVS